MGVLPLQFADGQNAQSLGLTGHETFDITGIDNDLKPGQVLDVTATGVDGSALNFKAVVRLDTPVEVNYYHNGGILHTVLRNMAREEA